MKWFKHMADSADDEKLAKLIGQHGMEGYGLWWLMLEVVAKQMPKDGTKCDVTYPLSYWMRLTGIYHHSHFKKILQSLSNLDLILVQCPANVELISGLSQRDVFTISVPNLLKFRDEYSKKSGQKKESVGPKKEKQNTDTDTDIKPTTTTRAQEQLIIAVEENNSKLKILFPDINLAIATEKLLNHHRAGPILLDPYATALKWFQSEFPQNGGSNGKHRTYGSTAQTGRKAGFIEANGAGTDFMS